MIITMYASIKNHETTLPLKMERSDAYYWVLAHAHELNALDVDCGVNVWSWSPELGWRQFPRITYVPGKSVVLRSRVVAKMQGNGRDCRHPWRYSMPKCPAPNPLHFVA